MNNFTPFLSFLLGFFLVLMTSQTTSSSCVNITAALTGDDYGQYIFSGNQYTYHDIRAALSENAASAIKSTNDWIGMDQNIVVNAGYMEFDSNHVIKLFAGNDDMYRVDLTQGKVLEKTTASSMFTAEENALLEKGVQAAAIVDKARYFFSGCNLLKTNMEGVSRHFNLQDLSLPCDVDSAFTYPQKTTNHLMVTKGGRAYGWFPSTSTSMAYDMFCVANVLTDVEINLCQC